MLRLTPGFPLPPPWTRSGACAQLAPGCLCRSFLLTLLPCPGVGVTSPDSKAAPAWGPPQAAGGDLLRRGPPWAAGAQPASPWAAHGPQGNLCSAPVCRAVSPLTEQVLPLESRKGCGWCLAPSLWPSSAWPE